VYHPAFQPKINPKVESVCENTYCVSTISIILVGGIEVLGMVTPGLRSWQDVPSSLAHLQSINLMSTFITGANLSPAFGLSSKHIECSTFSYGCSFSPELPHKTNHKDALG
jgi:hypothetical protein